MTVSHVVDAVLAGAAAHGDALAVRETSGRQLTYAALASDVERVSNNLARRGLRPGDRVVFAVRPSIEAIVLILALLRRGVALVGVDLGMSDALFATRMHMAEPRWIVAESVILALGAFTPVRTLLRRMNISVPPLTAVPNCAVVHVGPRWPGVPPGIAYRHLRRSAPAVERDPTQPDGPAFIVFTSGTTDVPKAVVHTHRSLGATVDLLAAHLELKAGDVVYSADLHAIVPALLAGATAVVPPYRQRRVANVVRDFERFGVTHAFGTPAEFQRIVAARAHVPPTLRAILLGGAPIDRAFLSRLQPAIPPQTEVWCVYAMTEMLPVACISMTDKLAYDGPGDIVGTAFPGVTAQLATDRELLLRGPHLFRGYLGQPPVQELATGDLATLDAQGRIVLLGRKKDMIIRGLHNIYPALHEPRIAQIEGVQRCCLVGVYDPKLADERIVLAVEPAPGHDLALLKRRLGAALPAGPDSIDAAAQPDEIVFTAIPLDGRSHKVNRQALRERLGRQIAGC